MNRANKVLGGEATPGLPAGTPAFNLLPMRSTSKAAGLNSRIHTRRTAPKRHGRRRRLSDARLDKLIEEAIVDACVRGQSRQRVGILDLPLPAPPPEGAEWIAAYGRWVRGR